LSPGCTRRHKSRWAEYGSCRQPKFIGSEMFYWWCKVSPVCSIESYIRICLCLCIFFVVACSHSREPYYTMVTAGHCHYYLYILFLSYRCDRLSLLHGAFTPSPMCIRDTPRLSAFFITFFFCSHYSSLMSYLFSLVFVVCYSSHAFIF
jgi:hypothetical protein